jgi:hypothetical protein
VNTTEADRASSPAAAASPGMGRVAGPTSAGGDAAPAPDPLQELGRAIDHIRGSAADYLVATCDAVRVRIRNGLLWLGFVALAAFFAVSMMIAGIVLLLIGLSQGVASGLDVPVWGGLLAVGLIAILVPFAGLTIRVRSWKGRRLEEARQRYEARNAKQAS